MNVKVEPAALAFVSAFELVGLAGVGPTWTSLVKRLPRPARGVVVALICVYLIGHWEVRR